MACGRMQGQGQHRLPVEQAEVTAIAAQKNLTARFRTGSAGCRRGRNQWRANQPELKSERLVFIDETSAATAGAVAALRPLSARRAPRLQRAVGTLENDDLRCRTAARRGHRALCAGRTDGWGKLPALMSKRLVVPILKPGDIVVIDNLASHKVAGVREAIEAAGAELRYFAALQSRLQSDRAVLRQAGKPCCERPPPEPVEDSDRSV